MNGGLRILGIDFGARRVGISVSDPLCIIARALETLPNDPKLFERINSIIAQESVGLIVVGMPYTLKGVKGHKASEVERFLARLRKEVSVEVTTWDERFTSSLAHHSMRSLNTKRKDRREDRGRVDAMAAAIMLQSFLDSRKRSMSCS